LQSDINIKIKKAQESVQIQPLTHCTSAGEVYQRTASVHAQIEVALTLTSSQLIEQARISDSQSPDYFQEECLVYLIRDFHRRSDTRTVNDLAELLIRRCQRMIYGRLLAFDLESVEDAVQDVIADLFDHILDLKSGRSDFLQVRFWLALKSLIISVYRRYLAQAEKAENVIPLSSLAGYELEKVNNDMPTDVSLDDVVDHSISVERLALCREGLMVLEERYRRVFIMRYYGGWQIESTDPSMPTLSRYFKKTPRTIQSWLTYAENVLEHWRGEQYGAGQ
jgi:DNA-directed RNA polymerase specialized sigma24 family protein